MKKIAIALCAVCFLGGTAMADPLEDIIGAASLDVDAVTVLDSERWAVMASWTRTDVELFGIDMGDSSGLSFAAAYKLSDNWQVGLGYATDVENFGDSYAIKVHARYGFSHGYNALK